MDLRNFYKRLLSESVGVPRSFVFNVSLSTRNFDASSNVLILISNLKEISAKNIYSEVITNLNVSNLFENTRFNENNGMLNWDIPKKIWIHQLLATSKFIKNFKNEISLPFSLNEDELFQIKYVYTRIHSVFRHFYKKFPEASGHKTLNLDLISRKDIINLIKVIASYPEWIMKTFESKDPNFLRKYLLRIRNSFELLWNLCDEKGAELCFILPNDFHQTNARMFVLDVLRNILEKSSFVLGFVPEKELR